MNGTPDAAPNIVDIVGLRAVASMGLTCPDRQFGGPYDDCGRLVVELCDETERLRRRNMLVEDLIRSAMRDARATPDGYLVPRELFAKMAGIYSPGVEMLRRIRIKAEAGAEITDQDMQAAIAAFNEVREQEEASGGSPNG